jgi:hypothetical protein
MSDEPTYVPLGDEFENEDDSWRYPDDLENQELIKEVFKACGNRRYFKTPKEARKWRRIDGQVSRGVIPQDWVEHCMEWVRKKNRQRTKIIVDALGTYFLNKSAMQDFLTNRPVDLKPKSAGEWSMYD